MNDLSETEYWIYHEKQQAMLCGQHSLNNLVQANRFSPYQLSEIAHHLDQMELNFMAQNNEGGVNSKDYLNRLAEGSGNVDESGNFSIEVLRSALKNAYGLDLINVRQENLNEFGDVTDMEGFIAHKDAHWFAIRKINGRFWNLNSMEERPKIISHFKLATEIAGYQSSGCKLRMIMVYCCMNKCNLTSVSLALIDTVFCVPLLSHECPPCTSKSQRQRGLPEYWWKEEDLVRGKGDAITGATDPWRDVGSGMRLDGKSMSTTSNQMEGMSEEEMIQMALMASMETTQQSSTAPTVALTEEPAAGVAGAVRIQFRLPDGSRAVRRFLQSDPVGMLYAFVESTSKGGQGRAVELRAGFPPKELSPMRQTTIADANLAGEAVTCRFA
jgi:ataxin-3